MLYQVGSFLRPQAIHDARAQHVQGKLDDAGLRAVEDEQCVFWPARSPARDVVSVAGREESGLLTSTCFDWGSNSVREVVRQQEEAGLRGISDGEFRVSALSRVVS